MSTLVVDVWTVAIGHLWNDLDAHLWWGVGGVDLEVKFDEIRALSIIWGFQRAAQQSFSTADSSIIKYSR